MGARTRSFHHRVAVAGVVLAALGTALYSSLAIPAGDPSAPVFVPATLLLVVAVVLVLRYRWALWLLVAGATIVFAIFAIDPFRLLHPDSFIDFVPTVLVVGGAALAWVSSIAAITGYRSEGNGRIPAIERVALAAFGVLLAGLCAYSLIVTLSRPSSVTLPSGRRAVVIEAREERWVPRTFTVDGATDTLVLVRNPDWIAHTFAVPDLGIDVYVAPRAELVVELEPAAARTYLFQCTVTGHETMTGTLRIA